MSVLQSEPVKALEAFADQNKETQGKFTIGDEKVRTHIECIQIYVDPRLTRLQKHNVFMRPQDPEIRRATGTDDPVKIMTKLREMKNNFK